MGRDGVIKDRCGCVRIGYQRIEGKRLNGLRAAAGEGGADGQFLLLHACRQYGGDRLGQRAYSKSGDPGGAATAGTSTTASGGRLEIFPWLAG